MMKMIIAIIRPERCDKVISNLSEAGYNAYTKIPVSGRGKQKGIQVGNVFYEEMPKNMLFITVDKSEKDEVIDIIINSAKSSDGGSSGDGKIFVTDISESYTISEE